MFIGPTKLLSFKDNKFSFYRSATCSDLIRSSSDYSHFIYFYNPDDDDAITLKHVTLI